MKKPQVADLGFCHGADDGNRTRAISLGITRHVGLCMASELRECPPMALFWLSRQTSW